jgi:hypothetical protein
VQSHEATVTNDIEERKKLSFEQAEGAEPLPSQLQLREISPRLRALLWDRIHSSLKEAWEGSDYGTAYLDKPWSFILKDEHVYRQHRMADDFENDSKKLALQLLFWFEVSALSGSPVSSAPERPCDNVGGLNPLSIKSDCNAADFLDW